MKLIDLEQVGSVVRIDTWTIDVEIVPVTLPFGLITTRTYTVCAVENADGATGVYYTLSRGLPVDAAIHSIIAPSLFDDSAFTAKSLAAGGGKYFLPFHEPVVQRAGALVEASMWDLYSQAAGTPIWQLLGGEGVPVETMIVEGYRQKGESCRSFVERLNDRVRDGHTRIKLAGTDQIGELGKVMPGARFVVDLGWCWSEYMGDIVAEIPDPDVVDWYEDPAPSGDVAKLRAFSARYPGKVGVGDEESSVDALLTLVGQGTVDVLRVDPLCIGVANAMNAITKAQRAGLRASIHMYPELAVHLGAAAMQPVVIEGFPSEANRDFGGLRWLKNVFDVPAAQCVPPSEPGLNLAVDWRLLAKMGHHISSRRSKV